MKGFKGVLVFLVLRIIVLCAPTLGEVPGSGRQPDGQTVSTIHNTGELDPDAGTKTSFDHIEHEDEGAVADDGCESIGAFTTTFTFPARYRGNLYRITDSGVFLKEIKMQLAFTGVADLYVSVHRKLPNNSYEEVDIKPNSLQAFVIISPAVGQGANVPVFYPSGLLNGEVGIELTPGDYAIGFAWGSESIKYGRDSGVLYPKAFEVGSTLALVSRELPQGEPPLPAILASLSQFTGGAYAQQLCFELVEIPYLSVGTMGIQVPSTNGSTSLQVKNDGAGSMPWTAAVNGGQNWLRIRSGGNGFNDGQINLSFDPNPGGTSRVGSLRVTAPNADPEFIDVSVIQAGSGILSFAPPLPWKKSICGYMFEDDSHICNTGANCPATNPKCCDPDGPRQFVHVGVDVYGRQDNGKLAKVLASAGGVVKSAMSGPDTGWGGSVVIEHDLDQNPSTPTDKVTTLYLHVVPKVQAGVTVVQGAEIATVQNITSGPHLHFGFRRAPYPTSTNDDRKNLSGALRGALPPEGTTGCTCCADGCDKKVPIPAFRDHWENPEGLPGLGPLGDSPSPCPPAREAPFRETRKD